MKLLSSLVMLFRILCLGWALVVCAPATAADLRLIAPNAAKEAVLEAVAVFEKNSGHKVVIAWTGTEAITQRLMAGEAADIVVNTAQNIERLTTEARLSPGSRTDFARSAIGVAVAPGAPSPDIASADALKSALLAAGSIVISSGTSGRYLLELFVRLGVSEQIRARVKQPPSGAQIADILANGEAELGFQQVSELIHAKGIHYLGPLPPELQSYTTYSGAAHSQASQPDAARDFLKVLRQPETAAVVRKSGMEPL